MGPLFPVGTYGTTVMNVSIVQRSCFPNESFTKLNLSLTPPGRVQGARTLCTALTRIVSVFAVLAWRNKTIGIRTSAIPCGTPARPSLLRGGFCGWMQIVDLLFLLHSSLYVLPTYALVASVGSHCSNSIQK